MTLTSQLTQLFASAPDALQIIDRVEALALLSGDDVYREAFLQLTGMKLSADEARRAWRGVTAGARAATFAGQSERQLRNRLLKALNFRRRLPAGGIFAGTEHHTRLNHLLAEKRNQKDDSPLGVLMLAIDRFEQLELQLPPATLKRFQEQLATLVREQIREPDCAFWPEPGRGVLLLTEAGREQAFAVAERIRVSLKSASLPAIAALSVQELSCSIGLAGYPGDGLHARRLLNTAEKHLHQAAVHGNRCCPADAERRRHIRRQVNAMVEFHDAVRHQYRQALVLDISELGIAIGCNTPLEKGARLTLRFRQPFWPVEQELQGTVRQAGSAYGDALPRFGVEFLQPATNLCTPILFN